MLRICPENKGGQYRVHEAPPKRNKRHVMPRSVIFSHEYDVADDVEDSKQHVEPDEKGDGYRGLDRELQGPSGELAANVVHGRYLIGLVSKALFMAKIREAQEYVKLNSPTIPQ